jgi:hypothetical protein
MACKPHGGWLWWFCLVQAVVLAVVPQLVPLNVDLTQGGQTSPSVILAQAGMTNLCIFSESGINQRFLKPQALFCLCCKRWPN